MWARPVQRVGKGLCEHRSQPVLGLGIIGLAAGVGRRVLREGRAVALPALRLPAEAVRQLVELGPDGLPAGPPPPPPPAPPHPAEGPPPPRPRRPPPAPRGSRTG